MEKKKVALIIGKTFLLASLMFGSVIMIYNSSKYQEYQREIKERNYLNSVYRAKKDPIKNVYKLQLDSLNKDYQTNLKNLEEKFKD
jgi:bifunctional pyridoxal-dependent enzyme with beta-cystathionase and maltose regulon repressor activities